MRHFAHGRRNLRADAVFGHLERNLVGRFAVFRDVLFVAFERKRKFLEVDLREREGHREEHGFTGIGKPCFRRLGFFIPFISERTAVVNSALVLFHRETDVSLVRLVRSRFERGNGAARARRKNLSGFVGGRRRSAHFLREERPHCKSHRKYQRDEKCGYDTETDFNFVHVKTP